MKILSYLLALSGLFLMSCQTSEPEAPAGPVLHMDITHYYSVKMMNDSAVIDTLKDCFHCNQALVYDSLGREAELRFYRADMENMHGYEVYHYNEEGIKTGSSYYENDSLTTKYLYSYDQDNRLFASRAISAATGEMIYGSRYQYDEQGNQYETASLNAKGDIVDYYVRTYNKYGVVTQENILDPNREDCFEVLYEYQPKADSSWQYQLTYYFGKPSEIRTREKVYFPE